MSVTEYQLPLRIVVRRPPAGVRFALQRGDARAGQAPEVEEIQDADGTRDLAFYCTVRVRPQPDGTLRFLGPFAHGPTGIWRRRYYSIVLTLRG